MIEENEANCHVQLTLKVKSMIRSMFNGVFRQGVRMEIRGGSSIREVVVDQLGIEDDYLENRVQTLFLNGKPVDDVNDRKVADGSVLALSAAMPGLAGATLRKGGKYAAFRRQISEGIDLPADQHKGWMTLKLFNQVAEEQAPLLLKKGIWISGDAFLEIFRKVQDQSLMPEILKMEINGNVVDPGKIPVRISRQDAVFLKILEMTR